MLLKLSHFPDLPVLPSRPLLLFPSLHRLAVVTLPSSSNALPLTPPSPLTTFLSLSFALNPTLLLLLFPHKPTPLRLPKHLLNPTVLLFPFLPTPSIYLVRHFDFLTLTVLDSLLFALVQLQISPIAVIALGNASSSRTQFNSSMVVDLLAALSPSRVVNLTF